jgi:UDP-glucose 4-epimerase
MRSIITGGAGFIGSHLVDKLLNMGHEVIVLDNYSTGRKENLDHISNKIKQVECDLSIKGDWIREFENIDFVFHLASLADIVPSIQNPEGYFRSNVDATFYVLEAARHANVRRFIYSASSSCYGIPDKYPTPEGSEIKPQYPYALAKRMGEELVEHWAQLYNLPTISLRFFNVYGARSRTSGTYGAVFGVFLAQKLSNKPYTVVGDGNQTRDFTYVTDIVSALVAAAESSISNQIYNVGSDTTVSINKIVKLLGGDKVYIPKRPGEPDCTYADISKIKNDLGWCPTISIEEGIDKILEDINYWNEATVWEPKSIADATSDWFKYLDK